MPKTKSGALDVYVGERLREIRIRRGATQEKTGRIIEVTIQQVQKYEKGDNRISAVHLFQLAQFFGVDIRFFFPPAERAAAKHERNEQSDREAQAVTEFASTKNGFAFIRAVLALDRDTRSALLAFAQRLARKRSDDP
jgi:transcriptional regulator with XRE-family HTH domain